MKVPMELCEGLESEQCTNHFSHFLFLNLVIDLVKKAPGKPRVISRKLTLASHQNYVGFQYRVARIILRQRTQNYIGENIKMKSNIKRQDVKIQWHGHHTVHPN